jgi:hypothetical protein
LAVSSVVDALKLRREQQETDRLAAGVEFWEDWGLVFTTRFGTPLSPRNDYRDFQRLVGAAGLRFGCTTCGTPLLRLCWPRK